MSRSSPCSMGMTAAYEYDRLDIRDMEEMIRTDEQDI